MGRVISVIIKLFKSSLLNSDGDLLFVIIDQTIEYVNFVPTTKYMLHIQHIYHMFVP